MTNDNIATEQAGETKPQVAPEESLAYKSAEEDLVLEDEKKASARTRKILAVIFVILVLLLCGVGAYVVNQASPGNLIPSGRKGEMRWIRSIYGFGSDYGQLTIPTTTKIDPANGTFWITDPSFKRLVNYRLDGTLVGIIGKRADEPGAFRQPTDLAVDNDGLIYVIESTYGVVRVFDKKGVEQGSFEVPQPLSIEVSDNLIVVGANDGFVIMDKNANIINVVGTNGKGDDQFDKVNGIAIDEQDNIYISDTFNNRLSKYDKEGNRIWIVETGYPGNQQMTGEKEFETDAPAQLQLPMGLTLDGNGNLVVIDMHDFSIAQFNPEDGSFIAKYGSPGREDGKFMYPSDLDYDPRTDSFVIADTGANRAQVVQIPNSGGSVLTDLRAALAGPLAMCCIPIILLIIVLIIAYFMSRNRRRKEAEAYKRYIAEFAAEQDARRVEEAQESNS